MPPEATITACARNEKSPTVLRELLWPRSTLVGSRIAPLTPSTTPLVIESASTRWRNLKVSRPLLPGSPHKTPPAKRQDCRPAEVLSALRVPQKAAFPGRGGLGRGPPPRQSAADHDHVCIADHYFLLVPFAE